MISRLAKAAILGISRQAGFFQAVRRSDWRSGRLVILCYHGISKSDQHEWRPGLYVSQKTFRRRMQLLVEGGYHVLPLGEAIERLRSDELPPRSVAITFDDGFYDFYQLAFPILKQFSFPATVYLTSCYADRKLPVFDVMMAYLLWRHRGVRFDGVHEPLGGTIDLRGAGSSELCARKIYEYAVTHKLNVGEQDELIASLASVVGEDYDGIRAQRLMQIMNREELSTISAAGVDIQLHTHRHRTPRDHDLFIREVNDNRQFIYDVTGRTAVHFCYPSGVYAPEFFPWLKECAVESATTCDLGIVNKSTPLLAMPRILDSETMSDTEFESWISGFRPLFSRTRMRLDANDGGSGQ
jgi:peptidoglycan/xylan/chitin deacetylase (PgdA/CDA1 family)